MTRFEITDRCHVTLSIINSFIQEITILVDEVKQIANYQVYWSPENQPAGIYFYKLSCGGQPTAGKLELRR
jgi:hypothetical protein